VRDTAYTTYRAMLFYLVTGYVDFLPLTSDYRAQSIEKEGADPGPAVIIPAHILSVKPVKEGVSPFASKAPHSCSPKSMYRLADAHMLPGLKELSLKSIISSLTPDNVLLEVFSNFSTKYDAVSQLAVDFMVQHWVEVKKSPAWKTFPMNPHVVCISPNHQAAWSKIVDL